MAEPKNAEDGVALSSAEDDLAGASDIERELFWKWRSEIKRIVQMPTKGNADAK
jgi:hypothetical protein